MFVTHNRKASREETRSTSGGLKKHEHSVQTYLCGICACLHSARRAQQKHKQTSLPRFRSIEPLSETKPLHSTFMDLPGMEIPLTSTSYHALLHSTLSINQPIRCFNLFAPETHFSTYFPWRLVPSTLSPSRGGSPASSPGAVAGPSIPKHGQNRRLRPLHLEQGRVLPASPATGWVEARPWRRRRRFSSLEQATKGGG